MSEEKVRGSEERGCGGAVSNKRSSTTHEIGRNPPYKTEQYIA